MLLARLSPSLLQPQKHILHLVRSIVMVSGVIITSSLPIGKQSNRMHAVFLWDHSVAENSPGCSETNIIIASTNCSRVNSSPYSARHASSCASLGVSPCSCKAARISGSFLSLAITPSSLTSIALKHDLNRSSSRLASCSVSLRFLKPSTVGDSTDRASGPLPLCRTAFHPRAPPP